MICCGPGAHALTSYLAIGLPVSTTSSIDERSRATAGLLPWMSGDHCLDSNESNAQVSHMYAYKDSAGVVEWSNWSATSGASSSDAGSNPGSMPASGFRLPTSDFRLSTFDDLMTGGGLLFAARKVFDSIYLLLSTTTSSSAGGFAVTKMAKSEESHAECGSGLSGALFMGHCGSKPLLRGVTADQTIAAWAWDMLSPSVEHPSRVSLYSRFSMIAYASLFGRGEMPIYMMILAAILPGGEAVCIHCKDTIQGCTGGNGCPAFRDWTANSEIFDQKTLGTTPKVTFALTPELLAYFTRPICEAVVGLACAPAVGTEIDFDSAAYSKSKAVVQAATYGHCSIGEALNVLSSRLEDATEAVDISKLKGALDSLRLVKDSVVSSATGTFMFIWTKISTVIAKRDSGVTRIELNSDKGTAQALTATLTRPTTESGYFEMLHYFIMVIVGLGIASYMTVSRFCDDIAWGALRMGESWQVSFELMCVYLKELDCDVTRKLTMGSIYRRGGQDTFLAEARRSAAAFFRPLAGKARGVGPDDDESTTKSIKPNGKFNSSAKRCCPDFNMGKPCRQLDKDGACKLNHRCNQFVSDKGKGGVCFGDHARCNGCSYDASKKLSKPATE